MERMENAEEDSALIAFGDGPAKPINDLPQIELDILRALPESSPWSQGEREFVKERWEDGRKVFRFYFTPEQIAELLRPRTPEYG